MHFWRCQFLIFQLGLHLRALLRYLRQECSFIPALGLCKFMHQQSWDFCKATRRGISLLTLTTGFYPHWWYHLRWIWVEWCDWMAICLCGSLFLLWSPPLSQFDCLLPLFIFTCLSLILPISICIFLLRLSYFWLSHLDFWLSSIHNQIFSACCFSTLHFKHTCLPHCLIISSLIQIHISASLPSRSIQLFRSICSPPLFSELLAPTQDSF